MKKEELLNNPIESCCELLIKGFLFDVMMNHLETMNKLKQKTEESNNDNKTTKED